MKKIENEIGFAGILSDSSTEVEVESKNQSSSLKKFISYNGNKQSTLKAFSSVSGSSKTNGRDLNSTTQSISLLNGIQSNCSYCVPLISEMTSELEAMFQLISAELPVLPC